MPRIVTDIDATEVVLMLAPETNGHVAVQGLGGLGKQTGRDHVHLALHREDEKIRFRDIQAQPRKIISSPTWSGWRAKGQLQRRLHQCARADPMAHPHRAASSSTRTTRGCATFGEGCAATARR
jgi:nitrate reductase alpha subunit